MPAIAIGFCRARQTMVSGQSATSDGTAVARPALGLAAPSPDRRRIIPDSAALAYLSGARNPGLIAGPVCQARIFSEGVFAISDLARAGSDPGRLGIRRHDGHVDSAQAARLYRHAHPSRRAKEIR